MIQDFITYRDKFGFTSLKPGETTQNGALFTIQYLLSAEQWMTPDDFQSEITRVGELLQSARTLEGLSCRYPGDSEHESMDNTVALLIFSALYDPRKSFAKFLSAWEKVHRTSERDLNDPQGKWAYYLAVLLNLSTNIRGVFNNPEPTKFRFFSWFNRSPGMVGLIRLTAGERANFSHKLALFIGQFLGLWQDHWDGQILPYIVWQYLRTRGGIWAWGYKFWLSRINKKFPNGMQTVMDGYFGPAHPLAAHFKLRGVE